MYVVYTGLDSRDLTDPKYMVLSFKYEPVRNKHWLEVEVSKRKGFKDESLSSDLPIGVEDAVVWQRGSRILVVKWADQ